MTASRPHSKTTDLLQRLHQQRGLLVGGLGLAVLAYAFVGHRFASGSWSLVSQHWVYLPVAIMCLLGSYLAASLVYIVLSPVRLGIGPTYVTQLAAGLVDRLAPAGLGGLGVNYLYLTRRGCVAARALAVVASNNALGLVGHLSLLALVLIIQPGSLLPAHTSVQPSLWWLLAGAAILAALLILARTTARRFVHTFMAQFRVYFQQPHRLVAGLLLSMLLTTCNVIILYLAGRAVGAQYGLSVALLILTAGVVVGTVTPSPGGLGGAEAALVAALVFYHVGSHQAISTAILFRTMTFWLPLLLGTPALLYSLKRRYI
jgi:uncharacterized membrane protein YbhN (UPF0104 family)